MKHDESKPITIIMVVLSILLILVSLVGCKPKMSVIPIETKTNNNEHNDRNIRDSIIYIEKINSKDSTIIKDSVIYKVNEKGDVLSKEIYVWKERYRENNYLLNRLQSRYDSLLKVKQSEIIKEVPYPVKGDTEYIEKELSWIQKTQIYIGRIFILGCFLFLVIKYRSKIFCIIQKVFFHN